MCNFTKIAKNARILFVFLSLFFLLIVIFFLKTSLNKPIEPPKPVAAEGFPQIPIYPGTTLLNSSKDPREAVFYQASWETDSQPSQIAPWYLSETVKNGWYLEYPPANPTSNIQEMQFSNKEYFLNISLVRNGVNNRTVITTQFITNVRTEKYDEMIKSGEPPEDK